MGRITGSCQCKVKLNPRRLHKPPIGVVPAPSTEDHVTNPERISDCIGSNNSVLLFGRYLPVIPVREFAVIIATGSAHSGFAEFQNICE